MNEIFRLIAKKTSHVVGTSWSFMLAVILVLAWAFTGPIFNFSDTWQLVINTSTTIMTFLIVFLIQNTQNRDTKAVQLKLDELILVMKKASNNFIDLEDLPDSEIAKLKETFSEFQNGKN